MQTDYPSKSGGTRLKEISPEGRGELPLVTVITAVYNAEAVLDKCLESVIHQDYPNVEHIVIDGGSKDGTLDILRRYEDRIALWISEPDAGVYDAWNKGLDLARGTWISFLGADDEYLPGAISAYMNLAREYPAADYLSSPIKFLHPDGFSRTFGGPWMWPRFSRVMCSIHVGSMHRSRLFDQYGRFDTSYRITGDYEFLLRPQGKLQSAFLPIVSVCMRVGGISDSTAALHEAYRAKVETGGRGWIPAKAELYIALLKYRVKAVLHRIRSHSSSRVRSHE
jgi:glycosyltransferase involved in cell wall biosynthesis